MKKRLLSAALALAMVLTMLPLTALPAFATTAPTEEGTTVYYFAKGATFTSPATTQTDKTASEAGWYMRNTVTGESNKYTYSGPIDDGIVATTSTSGSAKWYSNPKVEITATNGSKSTVKTGSFTLLGDETIDSLDWNLTSVKLNGKTLTISAFATTTGTNNARVSSYSITVSDDLDDAGKIKSGSGLALPTSGDIAGRTLTLKATNTVVTGPISVKNEKDANNKVTEGGGTITLTKCTFASNIEMPKGTVSLDGTKMETGTITMGSRAASKGGTVTLDHGSEVGGDITMNGPSTLNIYDTSVVKAVKLDGGHKSDVTSNTGKEEAQQVNPSWNGTTVNMTTSASATSFTQESGDVTKHTIKVATSADAGNLTLNEGSHVVTVDHATVGTVALKTGSISVTNGASAGAVTLGAADSAVAVSATVSGDRTTVTSITAGNAKPDPVTVTISSGNIGSVSLPAGYSKGTITGGTFDSSIKANAGWLKNVAYEITTKDSKYKYINSFDDAVSAYTEGCTITLVGSKTGDKSVSFVLDNDKDDNGQDVVAMVIKGDEKALLTLPDHIGGRKGISIWYDGTSVYKAGEPFMFQSKDVTLKATSTISDMGTINRAEVISGATGVSASVENGTIKLSGAVKTENNQATLKLKLTTTTGKSAEISCVYYDNTSPKTVLFVEGSYKNDELTLDGGAKVALKNTSVFLTLDGSGLRKQENIEIAPVATTQVAVANISGLGTTERKNLEDALAKTSFTATGSPAIQEAVNKVLATYTESSVKSAITNGQKQAAMDKFNTKSPTKEQLADSEVLDYTELKVQVYLDIKATRMDRVGSGSTGSITLNITPSYRLIVGNSSGKTVVVPSSSRPLSMSGLTSSNGLVAIRVQLPETNPKIFQSNSTLYAHHKGYAYPVTINKGGNGGYFFSDIHGFSEFTINAVPPVATVDKVMRDGVATAPTDITNLGTAAFYYDSLTDAVADVANGGKVTVNADYSGTTSIPVNGMARRFTVDNTANAGKSLTFTGASVTADKVNSNNVYTVELKTDTAPTTATVSVGTATGGTGRASATSVVPGQSFTYTATPSSGYQASAPTARADNGATVSVVAAGTNQWTITVPAGAKTVTVTPAFVLSTGLPFTDVTDASAWYFNSVAYCYNTYATGTVRLMQGNSDGTFGIGRTLTRAQVAQMLYNLAGRPTVGAVAYPFHDVSNSSYYAYDAINWAARNGIAQGYGNGNFGPEDPVTREELVVFLWRYAESPTYNTNLYAYTDGGGVHSWAVPAMRWATGLNILSGTRSANLNGTISPFTPALREQVAVTVEKFHRLYG